MLKLKGYRDILPIYQSSVSTSNIVYRAIRESDGRVVALKTTAVADPDARRLSSLSREFNILLHHNLENVPQAFGLIQAGPRLVLEMEYVDAPSLRDTLHPEPMPLPVFFPLATQLTGIVAGVHLEDLIHCDLTPGNILYSPQANRVWLIDFGAAMDFPRQARAVIDPDFIEGSPSFMSPEQTGRLNRGLDYRTDFYSLGVIFYRLLTGQLPFTVTDYSELMHCHIAVPPRPPHYVVKDVPRALSELVLKLMKKDAADRYQSAEGIHADLVKLQKMVHDQDDDSVIELATADMCDRFILPDKLYGRERECRELLKLYRHTADGCGQMVFLSGHSGIGKTSLVRELYTPLAEQGGYLACGKFDQYRKHQPYAALMEAFANLFGQILTENEERVQSWRRAIVDALGPNGRLLTDVIPELELLIGPQPEVAELPVAEARTRFSNVFTGFLEMLGDSGRPVLIFLDDLQWIDAPSLALLEGMASVIVEKKLMFIGAYRSNEVQESHRLAISLKKMRLADNGLHELELKELLPDSLTAFLVDTLNLPAERISDLSEILLEKTHGNPLFFKTMLNGLYADGYIRFDTAHRHWTWDKGALASTPFADNVVDMLQNRIPSLTGGQADMLGIAACLGNVFELDHLARLADVQRFQAAKGLMASVSNGLLQPQGGTFELLAEKGGDEMESIRFRFAHDRIQQAAYLLVDEPRKLALHLQIGRILRDELREGEGGRKLFGAVAHLNLGISLMAEKERAQLVRLNLLAGKKAKGAAAFSDAQNCLSVARDLLGEDCWQNDHPLALDVHLGLAEACYLVGDFTQAEELYGLIRDKSRDTDDILTLINIQAKQYHHQGRYGEAIELEIKGLGLLGIELPAGDEGLLALFIEEGTTITRLLAEKGIESLIDHRETADPRLIKTHELLFDLFADGYLMGRGPLLACAAAISTRLSVEKGTSPMSSIGYINYGTCLCAGGEYTTGHAFGRVAVTLADRYQVAALKNYTYHLFALSINHWMEPLAGSYDYWREASKLALESGSPYAGWVFLQLAHVLLASGAPLDRVEEQIEESRHYLTSAGMEDIAFMLELIVAQPVRHLRGATRDIGTLDDDTFNCARLMEEHREALFFLSHIPYSMLRATLIGRNIQSLETMTEWMALFAQTMQGQFIHVDCYFYFALHLTAGCTGLEGSRRSVYLEAIDENLERFGKWAKLCPANFRHKHFLLAAERKRLAGDTLGALDLYDLAIDAAYSASFIQDAALANELAALFWQRAGRQRLAAPYLEQAVTAYGRWGATGKVAQLQRHHPVLAPREMAGVPGEEQVSVTDTRDFSARLDLMSILKASQAVSQHMVIDKLAGELVRLAMQNAGATKAALQLLHNGGSFVTVKCGTVMSMDGEHIKAEGEAEHCELPDMVLNYVIRSGESLVLDDAVNDRLFGRSEYVRNLAPKSICCLPIMKQNEVGGLLYLENSETRGAFHQDRLQVLKAIASQAAISLENISIYKQLDDLNKNLEHKVLDRTRELDEKNRDLEILSTTDQLTGLYNRRYIDSTIKEEIERCRRYNLPLSLILLDIDHFKQVNDRHGHDIGDEILVAVSSVLRRNTRHSDLVGRWGGEEFLVLLPQASLHTCAMVAEKLREGVMALDHDKIGSVTASFGVAEYCKGDDINSLVKRADQALYAAKEGGRNRVVVSPSR